MNTVPKWKTDIANADGTPVIQSLDLNENCRLELSQLADRPGANLLILIRKDEVTVHTERYIEESEERRPLDAWHDWAEEKGWRFLLRARNIFDSAVQNIIRLQNESRK